MKQKKALWIAGGPILFLVLFALGGRLLEAVAGEPAIAKDTGALLPPVKIVPVSDAVQEQLVNVVTGQLSALRRKDIDAALCFASDSFRRQVTPAQFKTIIEDRFQSLAASTRQSFRRGQTIGRGATILVVVKDDHKLQEGFVYTLTPSGNSWQIVGCSPALAPELLSAEQSKRYQQIKAGEMAYRARQEMLSKQLKIMPGPIKFSSPVAPPGTGVDRPLPPSVQE